VHVLVVTNVYPSTDAPGSGAFVAAQVRGLEAEGVRVSLLRVSRREQGARVYAGLGSHIAREAERVQPDVVHVRYGGVMADVATRAVHHAPVLVTFCGSDLLGSPAEPLPRRLAIRYGVWASRRAARRAAGVVVVSENLRAALPRGLDPRRTWLVPDPVDLERFRPLDRDECRRKLGWDAASRHVLFPSSSQRVEKRFALARAAVDELAARRGRIELHALEGVEPDEVPIWMNASDLVLLTSTHEGSPNAVKEALGCDVPVVSVDVGDVAVLLDPVEGCFVTRADAHELADGIAHALAGDGRVRGRDRVRELSLQPFTTRIVGIYEELVSAGSA
jgi:glycosyltransferase involved in cell wall biosynthesis